MAVPEFNILTPNAMLGYGYKLDHFWYGMDKYKPRAIIVDSGSTDAGPYKLGMNKMTCGRDSYIRDLTPMLQAVHYRKIKLLIGSVGGDGSDKHIQETLGMVEEIAKAQGFRFKIATINAGIDRGLIKQRIKDGKVGPCGPVRPLTEEDVEKAVDVVAQMGAEPFLEALKGDPDIILGGRSYDPAPFAAFCMHHGVSDGVAWHMGKIMECGGICAIPKGRSMIATMRADSFDLTPLSPQERCTPLSVASHTLYEKTRPDRLPGPGGVLHLDESKYEQITEKSVRIRGARFVPTPVYQIKLEGVEHLGYRTIFIGGIRDPILISQIDDFLEKVRLYTQGLFPELDKTPQCRLIYHIFGRDAVMGPLEPNPKPGHEIGLMGEVLAPTALRSHAIANNVRASILHFPYVGQVATTGNFALPLSPQEQDAGAAFRFSLYHLVDLETGEETKLFPVSYVEIGQASAGEEPKFITPETISQLESESLAPIVKKQIPLGDCRMLDIANIIRSKNSGPYEITYDIMMDDQDAYDRVKNANVLTNETVKKLFQVTDEDIITNMYFDPALAWKCTIKRPWEQGSVGERDTLGTQQHAPLLDIMVPAAPKSKELNGVAVNGIHSTLTNGALINGGSPNGIRKGVSPGLPDRSSFSTLDSIRYIWTSLGLPESALQSVELQGNGLGLPSSFKLGHLAQASITLSALGAALINSLRTKSNVPQVQVPLAHAVVEFKSERFYVLGGKETPSPWGPIGGLHKTSDGHVRIHDSFRHHCDGALDLLGLPHDATREDTAQVVKDWTAVDLETEAFQSKIVIAALRSYRQWDPLPQAKAIPTFPITIRKISSGPPAKLFSSGKTDKCLRGFQVLELSRVIAAPVAGKTLAAHGADVLWITSPNLPDLPTLDKDMGRGKRTCQLDLNLATDLTQLKKLATLADVFLQSYRPSSLAARGLTAEALSALNPSGIVYGTMSAYGPVGPWKERRGFDSLVQTCSGMNVSEAEHYGDGSPARPTSCQALDHASGYFLATGILAALYRRATEGGSYEVSVSLAGTMKYLRSLGQFEGKIGFDCVDPEDKKEMIEEFMEERETAFGMLKAVKHSAQVEGMEVGWDIMPKPLGSDEAVWLR